MVENSEAALHALHHVLVALRARAFELGERSPLYRIIDTIEAIPLWIADPKHDRSGDVVKTLELLSDEYPDCRLAFNTARGEG